MRRGLLVAVACGALSALSSGFIPGSPALAQPAAKEFAEFPPPASRHELKVITVTEGLDHPWGMAFLPDGRILVTERTGKLRTIVEGKLRPEPVAGLPPIEEVGQGGLLGIALHPDYANNRWVYLSYAEKDPNADGHRTAVARFKDQGDRFTDMQVVFRGDTVRSRHHFGSRIVFGSDGKMYVTIGDRGRQDTAQDLNGLNGKVFRLNDDGTVPADNPFVGRQGVRPEIFTYGNRNAQGMAMQPGTGAIWSVEHGPQGGDEINLMRAGVNYGWPVITYGRTYGLGQKIGEGTAKEGMEQPKAYFVPSLAIAGMTFYDGAQLPNWTGDMVIALLAGGLVRADIEGDRVVAMERVLEDELGRTRDVAVGPDGHLYALIDDSAPGGKLVRVERK